jgi:hypothetical protein
MAAIDGSVAFFTYLAHWQAIPLATARFYRQEFYNSDRLLDGMELYHLQ